MAIERLGWGRRALLLLLIVGLPGALTLVSSWQALARQRLLLESELRARNADRIAAASEAIELTLSALEARLAGTPPEAGAIAALAGEPPVRSGFWLARDGALRFPERQLAPPPPPPAAVDEERRALAALETAEQSLARGALAAARTIIGQAAESFEHPALRARLLERASELALEADDLDAAKELLARVARESAGALDEAGLPIAPFALARLAELRWRANQRELACDALLRLFEGLASGRWRLHEELRTPLQRQLARRLTRWAEALAPERRRELLARTEQLEVRGRFVQIIGRQVAPEAVAVLTGEARSLRLARVILGEPQAFVAVRLEGGDVIGAAIDLAQLAEPVAAGLSEEGSQLRLIALPREPGQPDALTSERHLGPRGAGLTVVCEAAREPLERLVSSARRGYLLVTLLVFAALLAAYALTVRALTRELRLAALKSEFVSNVSHELRTPLTSIRMFSEMLVDGGLSAEQQRDYHGLIESESRRLQGLVDNVLDFARIERGVKQLQRGERELAPLVSEVARSFGRSVPEWTIRWTPPAEPLRAEVDPDAIGQILLNLLSNAVKYSGDGREILISLERRGERLVLAVEDRGIGIPPAERAQLFTRFYRGAGAQHAAAGAGLGLLLARELARLHGGDLVLAPPPPQGSRFELLLPALPEEAR